MIQKRELKPEQQTAAHTLDRHVSVTAGPGSGKTTVLVERFLHILRKNPHLNIDQIVAITFTKRAAREMRERLRKDLDRILQESSGDERQRWMRYKRTLDGAVINTIHGFCTRLLREFPVEARIDPQFLRLDQHDASILLEASVEETLTEFISRERELISELALGFGRRKLADALVQLYKNVRGQGLDLADLSERTAASHSTVEAHGQALSVMDQIIADLKAMARLSTGAESDRIYLLSNWASLRQLLSLERPSLAEYCNAIESLRAAARLTRAGSAAGIAERLDEHLWGENKNGPMGQLPQICFDFFAKDYAVEVIYVLKEVEKRYREKKQNLSALDFDDLQVRALELLDQPAVLARATERYRFFLVDEFQDTNLVQRELMHKLTLSPEAKRANLFIVGDRKQSIYGFRGADVDVFQQTTKALRAQGGIEQPLHLNFRSQPRLINFFNYLFGRMFQLEENFDEEVQGELGYVEFEPSQQQREQEESSAIVELLVDTKSPDDDSPKARRTQAERDAKQIAQRILALTADSSDSSTSSEVKIQYRDIALLFRAMTDVPTYEAVFRNANIPFQTVQGKGFYEREEISDLIQLLRFLDNKTDELALAAVLRSPLGGISDNALLALRCSPWLDELEKQTENSEALPRQFSSPRKLFYAVRRHREIAYIDEEDHVQLDRVVQLLTNLLERRNHSPLADLLRFAVEESEYLTVIAAHFEGAQKLANVQKLFTLAERFEHAGAHLIRDLVRYVEEFEAIGSREGEGQIDETANAVVLMTIHQAKGLEFPVVIIPNLHSRSRKNQENWFALDRHQGLTVKVPDGRGKQIAGCTLEKFRKRMQLREYFESIRLLYVAATRAQDHLILSGATDDLSKLNAGVMENWLKLIWQRLELQVSKSGIVNLGNQSQLAVTLNLADEQIPFGPSLDQRATDESMSEGVGSLQTEFPLLQPVAAEPSSAHRFSVTQLINYRRCARQYYFDRILTIPTTDEIAVWNDAEAPEPPANLTATLKGAVIHRFCETYSDGEDPQARLRESFSDVILARRAQLADRLVDVNADEAIKELWPLAQNYLSSELFQRVQRVQRMAGAMDSFPRSAPGLWSELSFRLKRPLGFVTGTIDKLLISPSDEGFEIEIIDFKTNRFRVPPELSSAGPLQSSLASETALHSRRARRTSVNQFSFNFSETTIQRNSSEALPSLNEQIRTAAEDYQLQMQAYALAVRQLVPELTAAARINVTLHFLQPDVEFHLDEHLLEADTCAQALDQAMNQIVVSTEPEEFEAYPAVHCRMCNFLDVCSVGQEWLRSGRFQVT